jgi:hypothetical protein
MGPLPLPLPGPLTPLRWLVKLAQLLEEQARDEKTRLDREAIRESVRTLEERQAREE